MVLGKASLALAVLMGAISMCHAAEDPSPEIDVCDRRARCGDHNVRKGLNVYCLKVYEPYDHYTDMITGDEKCLYALRTCNDKARQEPFICHSGPCGCDRFASCARGEPTMRPGPGPGPGPAPPPRSYDRRRRYRILF